MTKKILLAFAVTLALASCDPESVFVESQEVTAEMPDTTEVAGYSEQILSRDWNSVVWTETKAVEYCGHKYLVTAIYGAGGVDVEMIEICEK
jgi:hypothetical protein